MKRSYRFWTGLLALSLAGALCFSPISSEAKTKKQTAAEKAAAEALEQERQAAYNKEIDSNSIEGWPQGPQIYAESAIVMEASTGAILYNKDMDMVNYPASITKIMTALVTLENASLDETVTYSYNATHTIEAGSSTIGTTEGEELTVEQSLYALLLESANECGNGLAEHVAGSVDAFVEMMNQKAKELGCTNTNFVNPHGLHDENHYTSAHDMALIMQAALQNEDFVRISGTAKYQMPATNKDDEITYMTNHHCMIAPYRSNSNFLDDTVIAGKTGGTSAAKNTLVTAAERNGMTIIAVTMRTASTGERGVPLFPDTALLLDYVSENFTKVNVSENETKFSSVSTGSSSALQKNPIFGRPQLLISINPDDAVILPKDASFSESSSVLTFAEENADSDIIANLSYTWNEQPIGSASLILDKTSLQEFTFDKETGEESSSETADTQLTVEQETTAASAEVKPKRFIKINVRLILIFAAIAVFLFLLYRLIRHLMKSFQFSLGFSKRQPGQYTRSRRKRNSFWNRKKKNGRYRRKPKKRRNSFTDLDL